MKHGSMKDHLDAEFERGWQLGFAKAVSIDDGVMHGLKAEAQKFRDKVKFLEGMLDEK